jgi:DNA-binding transcriptional LysR family regulator
MNELEAMRIFTRVAELASFTRAAESLGLPKASTSVAVQRLESELGTQLLHRTTRKVRLTLDGRAFYDRCQDVLADVEELRTMFQYSPEALRGRLRVDVPTGFAQTAFIPHLPQFLQRHPLLEIELSCTDRKVDVVREGFDCVVRIGSIEDESLIARPLGELPVVNCASPEYVRVRGMPRTVGDLAGHLLIDYVDTLGARSAGFEYHDGARYRTVAMRGVITVNSVEAYRASCLAGLGIIQVPAIGVRPLIERGLLVEVAPELRAEAMPVSLLYAQRRNLSRRAKVFMDWLAEVVAPHLADGQREPQAGPW